MPKLKSSERKKAGKKSEKDKQKETLQKAKEIKDNSKSSKSSKSKTSSKNDKANPSKKTPQKQVKAFSKEEIKSYWKENFDSIIGTKELTIMIQDLTGYSLGQDLTAGGKNLRRYLRSLEKYQDGKMTNYRWSRKDKDDVQEIAEILGHYHAKVS